MKKIVFICFLVSFGILLSSCDENTYLNPSSTTITTTDTEAIMSGKTNQLQASSTNIEMIMSGQTDPTQSHSNSTSEDTTTTPPTTSNVSSVELSKDKIKVMFEEDATFAELKDEYNLSIESESDFGDLFVKCDDDPDIRFYFTKNSENRYIISYLSAPASILLPEYVGMMASEIPILLQTGGHHNDVLFMGDENFSYSVTIDYTKDMLESDNLVSIERRHTIYG